MTESATEVMKCCSDEAPQPPQSGRFSNDTDTSSIPIELLNRGTLVVLTTISSCVQFAI
jgi:hypothetical protein